MQLKRFVSIPLMIMAASGCGSTEPAPSQPNQPPAARATLPENTEPAPELPSTAVIVVVQGQEYWMGNDTYLSEDDMDRMDGAFVGVADALDALGAELPEGTNTALITYADKVTVRKPLGDEQMSRAALGDQRDYGNTIGRSLLAALMDAQTLLTKNQGSRRIVVVISDGGGQRVDITADLASRVQTFKELGAEVFTIYYSPVPTTDPTGRDNLQLLGYAGHYSTTSRGELATVARSIASRIE